MSEALYLYGFVPADAPPPPATLAGIGGGPVRLVEVDGVRAAVTGVPEEEWAPEAVAGRMGDLGWVADQGAVHERVVTWFVDHAHIVPVRLLTLYSGRAALDEAIRERRGEILAQMERLRGLREWDLKVGYRSDLLRAHLGEVSDEIAALDREIGAAPPGRRYLLERKREKRVEAEVGRTARRLAGDVLEAARPLARSVQTLALPRDSADLPVVLSAALLVEADREAALQERMAALRGRLEALGVLLSFTGPWAAYRFLAAPEETPPAAGGTEGAGAPSGGAP